MAAKQWFFLLLPLLVMLAVFILFLPISKDPFEVMDSARIKLKETDSLYLEADMVLDLSVMGILMRYVSNTSLTVIGNESHAHTLIQQPFETSIVITDRFVMSQGNYTCTNNLVKPVCYANPDILGSFEEGLDETVYESVEFLGIKKVNNRPCDAILANANRSIVQGVVSDFQVDDFSKVNNATFYFCIDIETGIVLESLWTIIGESNQAGYLVESSVNISKKVNELSFNVTNESFALPYEIVSEEEYLVLLNQTYEELSQDL